MALRVCSGAGCCALGPGADTHHMNGCTPVSRCRRVSPSAPPLGLAVHTAADAQSGGPIGAFSAKTAPPRGAGMGPAADVRSRPATATKRSPIARAVQITHRRLGPCADDTETPRLGSPVDTGLIPTDTREPARRPVLAEELVGAAGFEPTTTSPPDWCATRLRHAPSPASLAPTRPQFGHTLRAALTKTSAPRSVDRGAPSRMSSSKAARRVDHPSWVRTAPAG
jgi:hypothetical protein